MHKLTFSISLKIARFWNSNPRSTTAEAVRKLYFSVPLRWWYLSIHCHCKLRCRKSFSCALDIRCIKFTRGKNRISPCQATRPIRRSLPSSSVYPSPSPRVSFRGERWISKDCTERWHIEQKVSEMIRIAVRKLLWSAATTSFISAVRQQQCILIQKTSWWWFILNVADFASVLK